MRNKQWHKEFVDELRAEQDGKTSAEVEEMLISKQDDTGAPIYEHVFNPDTAPRITHRWVDRGLKMSCEGAGHPFHQVWKQKSSAAVVSR